MQSGTSVLPAKIGSVRVLGHWPASAVAPRCLNLARRSSAVRESAPSDGLCDRPGGDAAALAAEDKGRETPARVEHDLVDVWPYDPASPEVVGGCPVLVRGEADPKGSPREDPGRDEEEDAGGDWRSG